MKTSIRFYNDREVVPELVEGTAIELVEGTATELVEGSEGTIVEHFETSCKK